MQGILQIKFNAHVFFCRNVKKVENIKSIWLILKIIQVQLNIIYRNILVFFDHYIIKSPGKNVSV